MMRTLPILQALCLSSLLCLSSAGRSEDTEIYFNVTGTDISGDQIRGNILFILDTSGSMGNPLSGSRGVTRLDALREAMQTLLDESKNVRLGMMIFQPHSGAYVRFPISVGVDEGVLTIPSEASGASAQAIVSAGADDVVQAGATVLDARRSAPVGAYTAESTITRRVEDGDLSTTSTQAADRDTITLGQDRVGERLVYLINQTTRGALRFRGIHIPQGMTITSASLTLTIHRGNSLPNPGAFFSMGTRIMPDQPFTDVPLAGNPIGGASGELTATYSGADGITTTRVDVRQLVQNAISDTDWVSGDSVVLELYTGIALGQTRFRGLATDASVRPTLEITWAAPAGNTDHVVGLRFSELNVPQGATIESVTLDLPVLNTDWGTGAGLQIFAEDEDNATAFTTADNDVSGRTQTTANTRWTPDSSNNAPFRTVCEDGTCAGSDLTDILQEVVNRTNWCGGNSLNLIITGNNPVTGSPISLAFRESAGVQASARILVLYSGTVGCRQGTATLRPLSTSDQILVGRSPGSGGYGSRVSSRLQLYTAPATEPVNSRQIGFLLRFPNVTVPKNATINDASLTMTYDSGTQGANTLTIRALDVDNFAPGRNGLDIEGESFTTAAANMNTPAAITAGTAVTSDNLSGIVQEIVNRGAWASGNALALYFTSTASYDFFQRYRGFAHTSPALLRIQYSTSDARDTTGFSARDRMASIMNSLQAFGSTPMQGSMMEAALYWRGAAMAFGSRRQGFSDRLSHPGSYCYRAGAVLNCPGTTIDTTTTEYGVISPPRCSAPDTDDAQCLGQTIKGSPSYRSPFLLPAVACATNHQVVLTDGQASRLTSQVSFVTRYTSARTALGLADDLSCNPATTANPTIACLSALAKDMKENDQAPSIDGKQTVTTHAIAFDLFTPHVVAALRDLTSNGGGQFFSAGNAAELLDAFRTVTASLVSGAGSTVAAPSISTNSFNRLRSRDKIYFGLFSPDRLVSWEGNVRNYNICVDSSCVDDAAGIGLGDLYDKGGNLVTDPDTGRFLQDSTSLWASASDGSSVSEGGAGAQDKSTDSRIYVDLQSDGTPALHGTGLTGNQYSVQLSNWKSADVAHIRQAVCGTRTQVTDSSACGQLMRWWLGVDTSSAGSGDRWAFHDVLHSSPVSITYAGNRAANTFVDRLLVGTNDGALRFINVDTGVTEWRFFPHGTLDGLGVLRDNQNLPHQYGYDLTPTLQIRDNNSNGIINPLGNDFVRAFIGQRRGGNNLYALELTPTAVLTATGTVVPKILWRISGATPRFKRLGQTWSQPTVSRIATARGAMDVLVFGGGYDERLDERFGVAGNDAQGNAIYIVEAARGRLILSITGDCTGCDGDIKVPDMDYSIAGRVALLDSNGDGFDDRIYVGDTGGQIWRVDLAANILSSGNRKGSTVVGKLASISDANKPEDLRRFFERPAVVQVLDSTYSNVAGGEYDYVLIGTGDRPNPLADTVDDRFYGFRDQTITTMPDSDSNNLADSGYKTIKESDLVDVTSTTLDSGDATHLGSRGWYVTMDGDGEKVFSSPTVISGAVLFTSYQPVATGTGCTLNIGGGDAYNIDILTTKAVIDWDEDGDLEATQDRSKSLGSGIPSSVLPLFTDEGVVGIVGIEGGAVTVGTLASLPRNRTYWYEDTSQ